MRISHYIIVLLSLCGGLGCNTIDDGKDGRVTGTEPVKLKNDPNALRISLLGTGVPDVTFDQFSAATLVEAGGRAFLFDCGRGAALRLSQLQIPFVKVDKLFVTHLHSDHVVGIPDLWLSGWIMGRRTNTFQVWGPRGTRSMMSHLEQAFTFDVHIRRDVHPGFPGGGIEVRARDIEEGVIYDEDGVRVTAFLVDHGPVQPAFGYRLDWGDLSVGFSGDTRPSENLIEHCQGVDVLIHSCASASVPAPLAGVEGRKRRTTHPKQTLPEQAGQVLDQIQPRLAVFSHTRSHEEGIADEIMNGVRKHYQGPVVIGEDLMQIEIGSQIVVRKQGQILFQKEK